jgi:hypothetical protein
VLVVTETIVFDFVAHRVVLVGPAGEVRPAPKDLTLTSTGAVPPDSE